MQSSQNADSATRTALQSACGRAEQFQLRSYAHRCRAAALRGGGREPGEHGRLQAIAVRGEFVVAGEQGPGYRQVPWRPRA